MVNEKEERTFFDELNAAEKAVVILMRELRPYVKIEIKLKGDRMGEISVVQTSTLREDFPVDLT